MSEICYANDNHGITDEIPLNVDCQLCVETLTKPGHRVDNWMGGSTDKTDPVTSTPLLHDDLMGNIQIYKLWMRAFGKDRRTAGEGWKEFRKNALNRYDAFDRELVKLKNIISCDEDVGESLDIVTILQKGNDIDAILTQVGDYDVEFNEVNKIFEQFSQYLPNGDHRKKVDAMIGSLGRRYFNILQELNRKKEILRWTIPRLRRYNPSGNEIKIWLNAVESRSESFISNINNSLCILGNEDDVEEIVGELHVKKGVYEDFLDSGKGILGVDHHMHTKEVKSDVEEVVPRWDSLCENIEKCLNVIIKEKKAVELKTKRETNKIDIRIQEEIKMCACFTPFNIVKVGDGKYTFGTSKTVRLLRVNGSSVVVRIGGGWEYLYNFLLKADPCRATQHATTRSNGLGTSELSNMLQSSLKKHDSSFNSSVKRMGKSHKVGSPPYMNSACDINSNSVGQLDSSIDSFNFSECSLTLSASPISPPESKFSFDDLSGGTCKNEVCETPPNDISYKSTENMNRKKLKTRRISLIERQSLYVAKH